MSLRAVGTSASLCALLGALATGCGGGSGSSSRSAAPPSTAATTTSTTTTAPPPAPVGFITPDVPAASNVVFDVHTGAERRPISPFIYGMNGHSFGARPAGVTFDRMGGNRWTAYNWETNASNAGVDWLNQNDGYLSSSSTPAQAVLPRVTAARTNGAACMVTVPILGHVAADKNGGGDVNQTPSYLTTRFLPSRAKKPTSLTATPSLTDGAVYQDELAAYLERAQPGAFADAARPLFLSLDNEPCLWASSHPRLRGDASGSAGTRVRYDELIAKTIEYAGALKDVAPAATIFGAANYGWQGFVDLQGAPDASGRVFIAAYLAALRAEEARQGRRLLDVLDLHWYPEARGGGVRITEDDAAPDVVAARLQAPRSLWDPTYVEDSWITRNTTQPLQLLRWAQGHIDQSYPGTRLAVTEYYYGGGDHISGGIAEADVLGIFARHGVHAAALWRLGGGQQSFIYGGFECYRDYDGQRGSFGDTSVRANTSDVPGTSVHASVDAAGADRVVLVCINKTAATRTAGIAVTHTARLTRAEVYQLTSAGSRPTRVADAAITGTNAFQYAMPAMSVTTLVLRP